MKRIAYALAACSLAAGCTREVDERESVNDSAEKLNGALTQSGNLTRKTLNQPDEAARQAETAAYYAAVGVAPNGSTNGTVRNCNVSPPRTIASCLNTFNKFRSVYGLDGSHATAHYYNRGDLGIGREMHCVERHHESIACYVRNFAAGDKDSEFTFGMSPNIAFGNMSKGTAFATVAMVFRQTMSAASPNRVFFVVYGEDGSLAHAAPLDRHGISFNNAFRANGGTNPDPNVFGTPGVNFNNHIPSNCISCHGGEGYNASTHSQKGSLFLPFDLDQFEYENVAGKRRADQHGAFKRLNEMVRKVAAFSGTTPATNIKNQLDGWYNNTTKTTDQTEFFENAFDSQFVPTGWNQSTAARTVYQSVVRGKCRGCHVASASVPFNAESEFLPFAGTIAQRLCSYQMPHALQTVREFWQSPAPFALQSYFRGLNTPQGTAAANALQACGPGNVATLDPNQIMATTSALF